MARFHLSAHSTVAVGRRDDNLGSPGGGLAAYGPPLAAPALYTVVAAAKLALPVPTTFCRVKVVEGAVYVASGKSDSADIAAPAGFLITEGEALPVPVAVGDTHLLVVEAEPGTDTATDLNA